MPAGHSQASDNRTATWPCNISDSPALSLCWSPKRLWEGIQSQQALFLTFPIFYSSSLDLVMLKFISLRTIKQDKIWGLASIMAKTAHLQISHQAAQPWTWWRPSHSHNRPLSWDTETKLGTGCTMCCFNILKVSFGRSPPVLAVLCSGTDSNKKHTARLKWCWMGPCIVKITNFQYGAASELHPQAPQHCGHPVNCNKYDRTDH